MFFMVGVVYGRVHHRDLDRLRGLFGRMPVYSGLAMGIFFAAWVFPACAASSASSLSCYRCGTTASPWPWWPPRW